MNRDNKGSDAKPPAKRKPYSKPRVVSYGHVKDLVQGGGGTLGDGGAGSHTRA